MTLAAPDYEGRHAGCFKVLLAARRQAIVHTNAEDVLAPVQLSDQ